MEQTNQPVQPKFPLGAVLSVLTGKLLTRDGMRDVYGILSHMVGRQLFTHELPMAVRECAPFLQAAFPNLAGITGANVNPQNLRSWLAAREKLFGNSFEVPKLEKSTLKDLNPTVSFAEAMLQARRHTGNRAKQNPLRKPQL